MLIGATFATSVFNYIYSLFTIRYIYFKMLRNPQNGCKTARFVGDRKTCCKMLHKVVKEKSVYMIDDKHVAFVAVVAAIFI